LEQEDRRPQEANPQKRNKIVRLLDGLKMHQEESGSRDVNEQLSKTKQ
jgi:hypothetical protein